MHDDSTATGPHDERKQHDDAERRARVRRLYARLYALGLRRRARQSAERAAEDQRHEDSVD